LSSLLKFDLLDGMLHTQSERLINTSSLHQDVSSGPAAGRNIQMLSATPLTFVLRIDPIAVGGGSGYDLNVLTIFTMYFTSTVKKDAMLSLLATEHAFSYYGDGSINPGNELLRLCPLHQVAGEYGCVARFEIQSGLYDIDTMPILSVSPDPELCALAAKTWAYQQPAASLSFADIVAVHASIMRENFALNANTRKAFVIAQNIPWSQDDSVHDPSNPIPQYAQVMMMMIAFIYPCSRVYEDQIHENLRYRVLDRSEPTT